MEGNDLKLGTIRGTSRTLVLPAKSRQTHLYVVGGSGVGKSKLLEHLIRQDVFHWQRRPGEYGLMLLDPHGSVYRSVVAWMADNGALRSSARSSSST